MGTAPAECRRVPAPGRTDGCPVCRHWRTVSVYAHWLGWQSLLLHAILAASAAIQSLPGRFRPHLNRLRALTERLSQDSPEQQEQSQRGTYA